MITVKPLRTPDRKLITTMIEPEILKLLEEQIAKESREAYERNFLKYAQVSWDRSSYIRRVLIKHLDIKLGDF